MSPNPDELEMRAQPPRAGEPLPDPCNAEQEEQSLRGWYLRSRHRLLADLVRGLLRGTAPDTLRLLDAGCGSGGVTAALRQQGYPVVGCDQSPHAIARGQQQGRLQEALVADITRLPFPDASFDLVVCSEVLEHVEDDVAALKELLRVAKSKLLITVPAHPYLWTDSDALLLHHRRYSKQELLALIRKTPALCQNLQPFGAIPGLGILAYRLFGPMPAGPEKAAAEKPQPLAARFRIPGVVEEAIYGLSLAEAWISRLGLLPWGHAWWAVLEKTKP